MIKKFQKYIAFIFLPALFYACNENENNNAITGRWQAVSFTENGKPAREAWLKEVSFTFNENGTYEYHSTLNYKEAGHYRIAGKGLYTRDTLTAGAPEKLVNIVTLKPDTIQFEMLENGNQQSLLLKRE